jgi:hypothetical protein
VLFVLLAVASLAGLVAGVWNPGRYVILSTRFGNPFAVFVAVAVCAALSVWLLTPVRSEAAQHRRVALRWLTVALVVVSLLCLGIFGRFFERDIDVVARDSGGARTLVRVSGGADTELRLWAGRGLATRDAGRVGLACGEVRAQFRGPDELFVATSYGDFTIRLDPATGRPLTDMGATCSG